MLRPIIYALTVATLTGSTAWAGAWPREEGTYFLSLGGNVLLFGDAARPVHYDPTIYLEYGLTERLTLGLDGYTADKGEAGSLLAFARYTFGRTDRPSRIALSLGAGGTLVPTGGIDPTLRIGAHWGRGMDWGWIAADYSLTLGTELVELQEKVDLTLGYRVDETWTAILNAEAGLGLTQDFYAKVTPSVAYRLNERVSLRFGYTQALTGDFGGGVGFQTWIAF